MVIDTVGVKGTCERAFELAREHGFYFVGAHPMAGTQYSGYDTPAPTCSRARHSCSCRPRWTMRSNRSFWARCARWCAPWALASSA
ncbi:MAG: hypothetical protein ACLU0O_06635 [Collinsella sp.]